MKIKNCLILCLIIFLVPFIHMSFIPEQNYAELYLKNIEALSSTENTDTSEDCFGTGSIECGGEKIYKSKYILN